MRLVLALTATIALAGCGGDEAMPRAAAPASSPDAAELACADPTVVDLDFFAASGDPVADTRTLFEDELQQFDLVEKLGTRSARVVRGGRVVAVVRFTGDGVDSVSACPAIAG
jgi:hypothetical protein